MMNDRLTVQRDQRDGGWYVVIDGATKMKAGRRGYTIELNNGYFRDAVGYLQEYERSREETNFSLFDLIGSAG